MRKHPDLVYTPKNPISQQRKMEFRIYTKAWTLPSTPERYRHSRH